MTKENPVIDPDVPVDPVDPPVDPVDPPAPADPEDDSYRGKLNAQNRFLEKEGYEFKDGKWVKAQAPSAPATVPLDPKDLLALAKADLHPDDLEQVQEFASFKKISLADALNDPMMKSMIADAAAVRKTAEATNTKGARGTNTPSDADIAKRASDTGEVPTDTEGMQSLWRGRMAHKKGN